MRIYEINSRVHCRHFDDLSNIELEELASLGFDAVWMMGVWQISEGARRMSRVVAEDFEGSPYAVPDYIFNPELGGESAFRHLVDRSHRAGLRVLVDFVPNHMALDSPWIAENPEFFIRSDLKARTQNIAEFFLHSSGEVIAFGRDPFFAPWNDTAQVDYTESRLRSRMRDVLKRISTIADGVRCDMSMLVLRDCIRAQWYPLITLEAFDERMPREFWSEAITSIKASRPDFVLIAEAYWDKEPELLAQGFDLAYEKRLCDGLIALDAHAVTERLRGDSRDLDGSLWFIENHDEERAAAAFDRSSNLMSAALILSIPGSSLIHEGQMEGRRERLPVQRIRPLLAEADDDGLKRSYHQILRATNNEIFRKGDFAIFDTGAYGVVAFIRGLHGRAVAYIGQVSNAWHTFSRVSLEVSALAAASGARGRLRVRNLLTGDTAVVEEFDGSFRLTLHELGVEDEARFCLIEALQD